MNQIHKEQIKIISISTIACILVAGLSYAIVKIAVSMAVPFVWTVGESGIYQVIMIVGGIVAIAGIGVVAVIAAGGFFVMSTLIIKDEEEIQ